MNSSTFRADGPTVTLDFGLSCFFLLYIYIFFRFVLLLFIIFSLCLVYLYPYTWLISASRGFYSKLLKRISSNFYRKLTYSSTEHALPIEISIKHLESSKSTQIKSQNDRLSLEIPHESRTNLRVPAQFGDIKGGVICSKNSTFDHRVARNFCGL